MCNYNPAFVVSSKILRASSYKDHAATDMHRRVLLMSQNTHLSLRPIQTFYLWQSMTGTCLIKISDVLTLCWSNFKSLSGALN